MNFREVVDFLSHEDMTETVVSPEDPPLLSTLEALIGKAYRFTHALMAILEGGMDTRKAMETAISALVAEALKMQGGRDEMPR